MWLAGFKEVFGGYEAVSDNLLQKMNKINNFADNILYIKFCSKYDIKIAVNVIMKIPDETIEDVKESRRNLHYLRFFFHGRMHDFTHFYSHFTLYKESRYDKLLSKTEKEKYKPIDYYNYLPSKYIKNPYKICIKFKNLFYFGSLLFLFLKNCKKLRM